MDDIKNNSIEPNENDFLAYHAFWRHILFSILDMVKLNHICDNGLKEDELLNEFGITKDEFFNPNPLVIDKVKKHLGITHNSMNRTR